MQPALAHPVEEIEVHGPVTGRQHEVLTPEALRFLGRLVHRFAGQRDELLALRRQRQQRFDAGELPDFLESTRPLRESDWTVAPLPADLLDRTVEITGPTDRKMMINALNSGADVFMADLEDATAPTWDNVLDGQVNLRDATRLQLSFEDERRGRSYALDEDIAVLMVRPRGLHLDEAHLVQQGRAIPGSLVDFGLYLFHNAQVLLERGTGPYFYLPKLEHHLEARFWDEVIRYAQQLLGLPVGTVRVTMLVETLPAVFQLDELLHELREHAVGLNCGRWDYLFSVIKTTRAHPDRITPDRALVGMTQPFMRAYTQRVVQVCHRRGAMAIGGMAAQIPIRNDPEANQRALAKVRADKLRESADGHDGTWVAHPGLVQVAREAFAVHKQGANQLHVLREDVVSTREALLAPVPGPRTEQGLRTNLRVGVAYLAAWLEGRGCVPLDHLMEDAATAEISRAQVWQWLHHRADVEGAPLTLERVRAALADEVAHLEGPTVQQAAVLFLSQVESDPLPDFLTLQAYDLLTRPTVEAR